MCWIYCLATFSEYRVVGGENPGFWFRICTTSVSENTHLMCWLKAKDSRLDCSLSLCCFPPLPPLTVSIRLVLGGSRNWLGGKKGYQKQKLYQMKLIICGKESKWVFTHFCKGVFARYVSPLAQGKLLTRLTLVRSGILEYLFPGLGACWVTPQGMKSGKVPKGERYSSSLLIKLKWIFQWPKPYWSQWGVCCDLSKDWVLS